MMTPLSWIDPRYVVYDDGRIVGPSGKTLRGHVTNTGYLQVRLPISGKWKWFSVHRLVLRAFTNTNGVQGNHKNGDRLDNRLQNLEWCTASENMRHAVDVLKRRTNSAAMTGRTGELCPNSVPVEQLTPDGVSIRVWYSMADARRHGFSQGNISAVCRGVRKQHAGFKWRFYQPPK